MTIHSPQQLYSAKTIRSAFLWTRVLSVPFWGLVSMLTYILYKDMHITPLQITTLIALKPMSSLFAPYWSHAIYNRPDRIVSNLVMSNVLRFVPFLFLPWMQSAWLIIAAFAVYMMLYRASIPVWIELFKTYLPDDSQARTLGHGSTIDYCGAALFMLVLGILLDKFNALWPWLFMGLAVLGLCSTWLLLKLPKVDRPHLYEESSIFNFQTKLIAPWKESWRLIRERSDFMHYQIGFMLGGAGLMIMQPALPHFFVDTLNLSYTEMSLAISICKGIGVAMAAPFWTKLFPKIDIFRFSGLVTILATCFPLFLIASPYNSLLLYVAYTLYGIMQAGSELSWHISGLHFAKQEDSSVFSNTNVITVGLRGCIIPSLGAVILAQTNAYWLLSLGGLFCLAATLYLSHYSQKSVGALPQEN